MQEVEAATGVHNAQRPRRSSRLAAFAAAAAGAGKGTGSTAAGQHSSAPGGRVADSTGGAAGGTGGASGPTGSTDQPAVPLGARFKALVSLLRRAPAITGLTLLIGDPACRVSLDPEALASALTQVGEAAGGRLLQLAVRGGTSSASTLPITPPAMQAVTSLFPRLTHLRLTFCMPVAGGEEEWGAVLARLPPSLQAFRLGVYGTGELSRALLMQGQRAALRLPRLHSLHLSATSGAVILRPLAEPVLARLSASARASAGVAVLTAALPGAAAPAGAAAAAAAALPAGELAAGELAAASGAGAAAGAGPGWAPLQQLGLWSYEEESVHLPAALSGRHGLGQTLRSLFLACSCLTRPGYILQYTPCLHELSVQLYDGDPWAAVTEGVDMLERVEEAVAELRAGICAHLTRLQKLRLDGSLLLQQLGAHPPGTPAPADKALPASLQRLQLDACGELADWWQTSDYMPGQLARFLTEGWVPRGCLVALGADPCMPLSRLDMARALEHPGGFSLVFRTEDRDTGGRLCAIA